jgi:TorA maturation chaperone TorD
MDEKTAQAARAADAAELQEVEAACRNRCAMYGLLARLYRVEVDAELLEQLKATPFPTDTGSELMDKGYGLMNDYLAGAWGGTLTDLAVDYVRSFLGHGTDGESAAYLYESAYLSEKHLLMQDARDEVLAVYRSECVDKAEGWTVGEDHLAAELEFMQVLSERCAAAAAQGDTEVLAHNVQVQRAFLADHLMHWVPDFVRLVQRFSKTDFYRGLATLTEGFLALDAEVLNELDDAA